MTTVRFVGSTSITASTTVQVMDTSPDSTSGTSTSSVILVVLLASASN
jgi:hypothetical protein